LLRGVVVLLLLLASYLLFWPVPVAPQAWQAPPNPGYNGPYEENRRLQDLEVWPLDGLHGPEDIAVDQQGRVYASTGEGYIVRFSPQGELLERWVQTGGRPLGIEFDASGNLIVADAYRGLLSIDSDGRIDVLTDEVEGEAIRYADDLDIAQDGLIYFSDASSKFGAEDFGGTFEASLLDILEHGSHGRLLEFNPYTGNTRILAEGINFANGVAVSADQAAVLINETGKYRVLRVSRDSGSSGHVSVLVDNLPGFPDNLSLGQGGRYWVGLISPRSPMLDELSDYPFLRKVVQRLPAIMRPSAKAYGHVLAFDKEGRIVQNLQDPETAYSHMTGVTETDKHLYISSLMAEGLARIDKNF